MFVERNIAFQKHLAKQKRKVLLQLKYKSLNGEKRHGKLASMTRRTPARPLGFLLGHRLGLGLNLFCL